MLNLLIIDVNKSASITILQNDQGATEEITDEVTIEEPWNSASLLEHTPPER
jgi:hypothetical protein